MEMLSHIVKDRLLYIHASQRAVVAEAQQVGVNAGERHAGHRTSVRLKEQHAIVSPVTTLNVWKNVKLTTKSRKRKIS